MFIVLVSWFALQITGEVASVGKVLICWQVLAFGAGPFTGALVDRLPRRMLFIVGEIVHGAGLGLLAVIALVRSPENTPIEMLYGAACLASAGSLLSYPSSQALIQLIGRPALAQTVSSGMFAVQIGNIAGAALGGSLLAASGLTGALMICAIFSFAAAALAASLCLEEQPICLQKSNPRDLVDGILEIPRKPTLALAASGLLLAYASAHASNALLAGFVGFELKGSSHDYGWVAAMYSGGGLIGSIALACFPSAVREQLLIVVGTILLAAATAGFSTAGTVGEAVCWQGLTGLSFMIIRVGADVTTLKVVANRMLGRIRSNIDAAIGFAAIIIYLLPSLLTDVPIRQIYSGLAGLFTVGSCCILWMQWSAPTRKQPRPWL